MKAENGYWIELDGVIHVVGSGCCQTRCTVCNATEHGPGGTHMGPATACEACGLDVFRPPPAPEET